MTAMTAMTARILGLPAQSGLAASLSVQLGIPLITATIGSFADGERQVRLHDDVAGQVLILVGSTGPPVDSNLMAMAQLIDAARRSAARSITAVIPYLGYSRSDHMADPGTPLACRLVADLLQAAGLDRLVSVDLHSPAIPGFFTIPVTEGSAIDLLADAFRTGRPDRRIVVAPDAGAIKRAGRFASRLGAPLAIALKHRPAPDVPKILQLWGDFEGRDAIIVDDMISTGATIEHVARRLHEGGATAIDLAVVHPVMAPGAEERLRARGIRRIVVTDSLLYQPETEWPALEVASLAPLLADLIRLVPPDGGPAEP